MVISFIGLGDVGSRYSAGISTAGAKTKGFDIKIGHKDFKEKEERCRQAGVELVTNTKDLVEGSDIILVQTTCAYAIASAEGVLPYLQKGQIYVDMNSAVPEIKQKIKELVEATGAEFCDACTMNSPVKSGKQTEVVISGPRAREVSEILNSYGMNVRYLGERVGQASAYKVLRSVFTKSLMAILIETYSATYAYDITNEVLDSIIDFLKEDAGTLFPRIMLTNVVHSRRRADEIGAVADMLERAGLDNTMSKAAYQKLMWSANSGIKEMFGEDPKDIDAVIKAYSELSKK